MDSGAGVAIIIPMLRRPHRVRPVYESAIAATPKANIVFVISPHDDDVADACDMLGVTTLTTTWDGGITGDYAKKINLAYQATTEPRVFLGADDLDFHAEWYERATARLTNKIQVIGTNDLTNIRTMHGDHSTHSLVTRAYVDKFGTIDEPGKVLHEGYPHEFVDDEFVETARYRGAFACARDSYVEHLHPMANKAPMDSLYAAQSRRMRSGRRLYEQRRHLWAD